jgi:hypothetical protein
MVKSKPPSKRVRLAAAVREVIGPVLREWGFENPPKGSPDWFNASRPNTWVRQRDGFTDEIYFRWDKNGYATFAMSMLTTQVERLMPGATVPLITRFYDIEIAAWYIPGLGTLGYGAWIGYGRSIRHSVRLALKRLKQANRYLLTGKRSINVQPLRWDPERRQKEGRDGPVFWWREGEEGEAYLRLAEEQRMKRRAPPR